jgi:hypothetical protein
MVLRFLFFSSIKTAPFYLLKNQSSAARAQPYATFWCKVLLNFFDSPLFMGFFSLRLIQHRSSPHTHANFSVWKSRDNSQFTRGSENQMGLSLSPYSGDSG